MFFNVFSLEVSVLWAAHQVHHSSEYYNLSTALRQSFTQQFTSWVWSVVDQKKCVSSCHFSLWCSKNLNVSCLYSLQVFYLPLALVAPPTTFAVHIQLNLLYQFWIHTEVPKMKGSKQSVSNGLKGQMGFLEEIEGELAAQGKLKVEKKILLLSWYTIYFNYLL